MFTMNVSSIHIKINVVDLIRFLNVLKLINFVVVCFSMKMMILLC